MVLRIILISNNNGWVPAIAQGEEISASFWLAALGCNLLIWATNAATVVSAQFVASEVGLIVQK